MASVSLTAQLSTMISPTPSEAVFSIHRYEILRALAAYLDSINQSSGRIACVGIGTGYELHMVAKRLSGWTIEGYDANLRVETVTELLRYFKVPPVSLHGHFPMDSVDETFRNRYDGIVMCELLEHLPDPERALRVAGEYLTPSGSMFITMAVNIAQEDHVVPL